jgi:rhamnosyltransferase
MVSAVIVLYNPNASLLDRLLRSVVGQVDNTYVIDNTAGSSEQLSSRFIEYQSRISYIPLGDNMGIATAQNIGIRKSMAAGYSHVLLLDQDSAVPPDMVNQMLHAEEMLVSEGKQVAAVGPIFVDEKTGKYPRVIQHMMQANSIDAGHTSQEPIRTDWFMASGSLIRIAVFSVVGVMLDDLFIDFVDSEWGLRAKSKGYNSYILPHVLMRHSTGDAVAQLLGREIFLHASIRNCYIVRNATYLLLLSSMGWKWRIGILLKIPSYILVYSWFSDRRLTSFLSLVKALADGVRGQLGRVN